MWWWVASAMAGDFGRQDEILRVTRYMRLRGTGPVYGRWRNRNGAHLAWRFPDGQIEHVDTFDGKALASTQLFAADGSLRARVDWATQEVELMFQPAATVPFGDWAALEVGGVQLRGPGLAATGEGTWTAGGVHLALQEAADPFQPRFAAELVAGCGCEIEARMTTWIAGRPAAHFRLYRGDRTADLVAMPAEHGLLVLAAAGPDLSALHPLRAMMATARGIP